MEAFSARSKQIYNEKEALELELSRARDRNSELSSKSEDSHLTSVRSQLTLQQALSLQKDQEEEIRRLHRQAIDKDHTIGKLRETLHQMQQGADDRWREA